MADVKRVITTTGVPVVIKNRLKKWPVQNLSDSEWCRIFSGRDLIFRKGCHGYKQGPRWESSCKQVKMSLDKFFEVSQSEGSEWLYYDYKDMRTIFGEEDFITRAVRWEDLGYPEVTGQESTLWIGNKGAHTPCHMDSYGYNLVAQLYGRKLWILISPEETSKMRATRVPYEESSVYSELDFYTPSAEILSVKNVYKVILEPGQVLCVPRHWWHYVENLGVAITVNTWIPTDQDDESRLDEALVQRFVWSICQDLTAEDAEQILNPNERDLPNRAPSDEILQTVGAKCLQSRSKARETPDSPPPAVSDISVVPKATSEELRKFLSEKAEKFNYDPAVISKNVRSPLDSVASSKMLINAFCHPETIAMARERLLINFTDSENGR